MKKINLEFPDGSSHEYDVGTSGLEVVKDIGERLAKDAIAVKVNDDILDMSRPITTSGKFKILTFRDEEGKEVFKHSAAHVLAMAVTKVFPGTHLTIGPPVQEGFYYDFDVKKPFTQEDLMKLEVEMKRIVDEDIKFERLEVSSKEAKKRQIHNPYKVEMIDELGDEQITLYKNKDFIDLCRGPHVPSTGRIKSFKLTKLAGAYWRGDAKNKQLQRVYGVAFPDKKDLKNYLRILEEAQRRDHRKLGRELDLFSFQEEAPGMVFFHNKGTIIYNSLTDFMRKEMIKRDYQENKTPIILNKDLWLKSGHWGHYKENMYFTKIDEKDYAVKPMNCPGNLLIYKSNIHSYRELPIRAGEFGLVHRHELSGVLSGLFRVRCFTQDDAHVFCTEDQLESEIEELIEFIDFIYKTFNFEYSIELSTKPEKAMGSQELWDKAEGALKNVLEKRKTDFKINEGDGAFYGPKIDFHLKDAIQRTWQCGTIQVDFSMPEKFDLEYDGKDGAKHRPVMLHRAIYGSIERFLGILIEHYAGRFPLWISPIQVRAISITDNQIDYVTSVMKEMKKSGFRIDIDNRTETMNYKVRDAQLQQINYILVCGDKEKENGTVNVRTREGKILGEMKVSDLIKKLNEEIINKT